jgi:hypothetical protein
MGSEVTITDPERVADFERVFGSATVPVKERLPVPTMLSLPIGPKPCYMLDLDALTNEQRERLLDYATERFGMTRDEAERELPHGFPILAESCIFVTDGRDFL